MEELIRTSQEVPLASTDLLSQVVLDVVSPQLCFVGRLDCSAGILTLCCRVHRIQHVVDRLLHCLGVSVEELEVGWRTLLSIAAHIGQSILNEDLVVPSSPHHITHHQEGDGYDDEQVEWIRPACHIYHNGAESCCR